MTSKETAPGSNNVPPIPKPPKDFLKNSPFVRGEEQDTAWSDLMSDMRDIQAAEDAKEDNPGFFRRAGERINGWAGKVKEKLGDTALGAALTGSEASKGGRGSSRHIELVASGLEASGDLVENDSESQSGDSGEGDKSADSGEQDKKQKRELTEEEKRLLGQREKKVKSAEERLARVAEEHGEESDAYERAENDLWMQREFLKEVKSAFGSPAEHSDETDGDKPEQAQAEVNSSDGQDTSSSSAEGKQDSQGDSEQNQGSDNISAAIVKARRQATEELQAKLDGLEPGSEDYEATKAALEESQKRLRHAERSYIEGKSTVEESSSTAETAKKGTDDSVEKTKPAGDASTVETDDSSESETVDDSVEAAKKDLEKERSVVAKDLTEAMQQLSEHKPGDPAYNGLLARVKGLRNRFNYISEQIKEESGTDGKRDDIEDKNKGSAESQETSESEDDKKDKKSPEAPTPDNDLEQKVAAARNKYAEIRAEYEQTGMFKKLLKGKELKKRMELARAELEGFMTQLVYQQKDKERSIIVNGVEGANEEEQKEARQKAIQSIAAAVLEQHALVDEKTQEEYDKRLDERSLFKKVAAKIGQWFVGKENKDGGKLGLGGWLRSGGAGLAAGVTLGIFGVSFPISSVVGSVSSAGVKVAAHQRALENARGEKRKLSDEELASFGSAAQSLEWTTEGKDGSDRKDQSGEAVASMVGAALAETQKDTEKRQKNLTAVGSKAAMGWAIGVAAGRVTTELIKSHITPDQKLANTDPGNGGGGGKDPGNPGSGSSEATQPADVTEVPEVTVTPPPETVSLGSDGWVWDRVADVLGAEKATPFLEQLAQTNPDFQLIDLPNGLTGIAYQGNTDPQVVADAVGKVAPDLLKQWVLKA